MSDLPAIDEVINKIAQDLVLLDLGDWQSLLALQQQAETLSAMLVADSMFFHKQLAERIYQLLDDIIHERVEDKERQLQELNETVTSLQNAEPVSDSDPAVEIPDQTLAQDDPILVEFIGRTISVLDVLEEHVRNIERKYGIHESLSVWRREIHTIKGESGMLGLDDVNSLCNTIEEALDETMSERIIAGLYHSLDWLRMRLGDNDLSRTDITIVQVIEELTGKKPNLEMHTPGTFTLTADPNMLGRIYHRSW